MNTLHGYLFSSQNHAVLLKLRELIMRELAGFTVTRISPRVAGFEHIMIVPQPSVDAHVIPTVRLLSQYVYCLPSDIAKNISATPLTISISPR